MPGSFTALYYHIVFGTKDRQSVLDPDIAPRVHEYLAGIIRTMQGTPIIVGGVSDHVHILAALDKSITIPDALRDLKAGSSKWIHETFPAMRHFAWQEGYGAFSVSVMGLDRVKLYIERQEEHHRALTFRDEFADFLHRHGIQYDERYIPE